MPRFSEIDTKGLDKIKAVVKNALDSGNKAASKVNVGN